MALAQGASADPQAERHAELHFEEHFEEHLDLRTLNLSLDLRCIHRTSTVAASDDDLSFASEIDPASLLPLEPPASYSPATPRATRLDELLLGFTAFPSTDADADLLYGSGPRDADSITLRSSTAASSWLDQAGEVRSAANTMDSASTHSSRSSNSLGPRTDSTAASSVSLTSPGHPLLPCDFVGLAGCPARYDVDDIAGYMYHLATQHLAGDFPLKADCWFCDARFTAESGDPDDRRDNFRTRMHHNADHLRNRNVGPDGELAELDEDSDVTSLLRPDFYLVDHAHDRKFITEEQFQHAITYSETPSAPQVYAAPPVSEDGSSWFTSEPSQAG